MQVVWWVGEWVGGLVILYFFSDVFLSFAFEVISCYLLLLNLFLEGLVEAGGLVGE